MKYKTKKEPKFVTQTLAWCNRHRKKAGKRLLKRLPRGQRAEAHSCPCGKATGLRVYLTTHLSPPFSPDYTLARHPNEKLNPLYVSKFVAAFDSGKLPQYEL